MKNLILLALLMTTACKVATKAPEEAAKADPALVQGAKPAGPPAGPPPIPPYQMRDELPSGDRLAGGGNGAMLFSNRCGSCHLAGGMGTNLLTKQRMLAGEPPETGLLVNRKDLTASYVKSVVRQGKIAMPRLSRTEVTDPELEAIAIFLGKAGK